MREILFRGKSLRNNAWEYGIAVPLTFNGCITDRIVIVKNYNYDEIGCYSIDVEEIDPNTLGQYTGLLDKNGSKIFEGDVIFKKYITFVDRFLVVFQEGAFGYVESKGHCSISFNDNEQGFYTETYEIIGNIYDNPELLKKE